MSELSTGRDEVLRLFLQHQAMLAGFLYTLLEDWELVEEAVQETAVFICSRWRDFTPGTDFGAWARTVARFRAREAFRRRRRAAGRPLEGVLDGLAEPVAEQVWKSQGVFSSRHKDALARCLQDLPDVQRRVVELHYFDGRPCERIAARYKRRIEAVYMTLSRVRRRLKACVERRLAEEVEAG